ncbi:MAG TPA: hypothetical protein PKI03_25690, partial [Pseudomonadota bacterium]|nr:hypothetical protein [Pseudomonadota bacterium]
PIARRGDRGHSPRGLWGGPRGGVVEGFRLATPVGRAAALWPWAGVLGAEEPQAAGHGGRYQPAGTA